MEVVGRRSEVRGSELQERGSPASAHGDREGVKGGFSGNRVTPPLRLEDKLGRRMHNHVAVCG